MEFGHILSPIKVGSLTIKNRFVVPAMGSGLPEEDGSVSERLIDYLAARAKGGFGLCITEYCYIDPAGQANVNQLAVYDDKFIPGLTKLTDAIHKNGGKMALQLHHAGRATSKDITNFPAVAPSPIPDIVVKEVPRELSIQEIYELVEKFGDGAIRAKKAGFDAVELHGGHGYLISQFLSPYSNKRTDEFGGSVSGRTNFAVKVIQNIKKKCGADFTIGVRISGEERVTGGVTIQESKLIARELEKAGANWLNISTGVYASLMWTIAPARIPQGYNIDAAEEIKKAVKIPVIGVGRINDPYLAEDIVESGRADLIALGRASIADPEFPNKVAEGRIDEIAPCVACMQRCLFPPSVSCMVNPFSGNETNFKIEKAGKAKKIAIVGAGPGGLEAAWIAARKGHNVVLFEKAKEPGGQLRTAAILPTKQEFTKIIKYYMTMGKKYGVNYRFGTEATADVIMAEKPDTAILATGGVPLIPKIPGIDGTRFITAADVLNAKDDTGDNILVIGGGMVGAETAEYLCGQNKKVTIIDMLPEIASEEYQGTKFFLLQRLLSLDVAMITDAKVTRISYNNIIYEKAGKESKLEGFDTIVLAVGSQSYNPLEADLKAKGLEIHVIGDAVKTRRALEAIEEATTLAINL